MKKKARGMDLTMAELRFAYKELTGNKMPEGEGFSEEGNRLYQQYGEKRIREALRWFVVQDFLDGKLDI